MLVKYKGIGLYPKLITYLFIKAYSFMSIWYDVAKRPDAEHPGNSELM